MQLSILINLCSYGPEDINLSDGLVVEQTFITSSNVPNNNLITFLQDHSARMASASRISYRRMNHKDFAFNIRIRNPNGSSKKVDSQDISDPPKNNKCKWRRLVRAQL